MLYGQWSPSVRLVPLAIRCKTLSYMSQDLGPSVLAACLMQALHMNFKDYTSTQAFLTSKFFCVLTLYFKKKKI